MKFIQFVNYSICEEKDESSEEKDESSGCKGFSKRLSHVILKQSFSGGWNMAEPIMRFQIFVDNDKISELECSYGKVTMIPFDGKVVSDLFCGETVPGGCDVQTENAASNRMLCAKYMFTGRDYAGNPCKLYVENIGFLLPGSGGTPYIAACPRFLTDSSVLGEYLCRPQFRSEVQSKDDYLEIRIYDVLKDDRNENVPGK